MKENPATGAIHFTKNAWEDYLSWQTEDKKMLKKINELIIEIQRTPFEGIGKPEPIKFEFNGCWSRRIDREHRLVYQVKNKDLLIFWLPISLRLIVWLPPGIRLELNPGFNNSPSKIKN